MFDAFKKLLAQVENESGRKLKYLKSNNGGEYCDDKFEEFYTSLRRVRTVLGNPHQNEGGKAHEQDGACQKHADTHWIAQSVLCICSQYGGISDQQIAIGALELWNTGGSMER